MPENTNDTVLTPEMRAALIDAGWRPPMEEITSTEGLKALPTGTIVQVDDPDAIGPRNHCLIKLGTGDFGDLDDFHKEYCGGEYEPDYDVMAVDTVTIEELLYDFAVFRIIVTPSEK